MKLRKLQGHSGCKQNKLNCGKMTTEGTSEVAEFSPMGQILDRIPHYLLPIHGSTQGNPLICSEFKLDLGNGCGGVQALGASTRTVEDSVATVQAHLVLELLLTLSSVPVSGICNPPVRLHQRCRTEVLVLVPPVRRATRRAASTQNALVETVEFLTVLWRLQEFALLGRVIVLKVRFDRLVLFVEESEIGNKVLDDVHMWERIDFTVLASVPVNAAQASKGVLSVDVHCARSADTLSAGASERQSGVHLVLDLDERIQNHWPGLVEINGVLLEGRFLLRFVRIPAIDLKLFHQRWFLCGNCLPSCGGGCKCAHWRAQRRCAG